MSVEIQSFERSLVVHVQNQLQLEVQIQLVVQLEVKLGCLEFQMVMEAVGVDLNLDSSAPPIPVSQPLRTVGLRSLFALIPIPSQSPVMHVSQVFLFLFPLQR